MINGWSGGDHAWSELHSPASSETRRPTGSQREFVAFYREHHTFVWRALVRLGVEHRDCDDATQEVFVAIHRHWGSVRAAASPRAWVSGIVRRIAWRWRRNDYRHHRRIEAMARVEPVRGDLETELVRREAWNHLAHFLDQLDDDKRDAFVLGELEELGRVELGFALGINPNTAYSRLQAARRQFFAHFAGFDEDACARLLAHAAHAAAPDERARDRGLAALVPLFAPTTVAATAGASTGVVAWTLALTIPMVLAVAAIETASERAPIAVARAWGTALATTIPAARAGRDVTPATTRAREPPTTVPAGSTAPPARTVRPGLRPPRRSPSAAPPEASTTEAELAVLLTARRAMVAGDLERARRELDEHRARFGLAAELASLRDELARELHAIDDASPRGREVSTPQ